MAITLIGSNLNTFGDQGHFETDPSTWGFGSYDWHVEISRTQEAKTQGLYACKTLIVSSDLPSGPYIMCRGRGTITAGKKYIAKAKIRSSASPQLADAPAELYLSHAFTTGWTLISEVRKTIDEINDGSTFHEIELRFESLANYSNRQINVYLSDGILSNTNGVLYVDEFSIYEYEDVPDPVCDIAIDAENTTVSHETASGANDGSITVATTGTPRTSLEYSKDGGDTWQSSNQFTGLAPAIYSVVIRESGDISCSSSQSFSVNAGSVAFDFTNSVTNETITGAEDGTVEVTTSGDGAPFTYSKDGGNTFQSSNIFTGLAPGTYVMVVKDSLGNTLSKNATVQPGAIIFDNIYFSKNIIPFSRTQTANSAEENYRIYNEVRVEDESGTGIYTKKMAAHLEPDENGKATFNLRPAFRGVLTATAPDKNETDLLQLTDRLKLYKNYYGDIWENKVVPDTMSGTNPFLVVMGGIDNRRYPDVDFFGDYLPTNKKFMTWAPREQEVDRLQELYLNYFVFGTLTSKINVNLKVYFDDGTTTTSLAVKSAVVKYGQLWQIPAGPNAGALTVDPAKNVTKYELWLTDQADAVISETMIYKLTSYKVPGTRYIMFLNSLGGYDVIRVTGKAEERAEVQKESIEKHLAIDYDSLDGQYESFNARKQLFTQYSTGFFKGKYAQYHAYWMQDLLLSSKVYDITTGDRIPIVIDGGSFRIREDKDHRYFMRFNVADSWSDSVFTPKQLPELGE